MGELDGLNVFVGSFVGVSDGVRVGSEIDGERVGETQSNEMMVWKIITGG